MRRGDLYLVYRPGGDDPKRHRIFVVVSRQALLGTRFATVICAPVFSNGQGLTTQIEVGESEGLKHASWILCDNLMSIRREDLTHFVGCLSQPKMRELDHALREALDLV